MEGWYSARSHEGGAVLRDQKIFLTTEVQGRRENLLIITAPAAQLIKALHLRASAVQCF
jgi:hypothetical protein